MTPKLPLMKADTYPAPAILNEATIINACTNTQYLILNTFIMAKKNIPAKTELIVNDIRLISVDRTMKDIKSFRTALRTAESIYFPNRTRLYDLYEDVLLDGHLTGIIQKRIDEVLNKELQFISNDKEVEGMENLLQSETFIEIMREIMLSKFWGVSGLEFLSGAFNTGNHLGLL